MFPHFSRRIPGFCTDIRRVFHIPTGAGYRTSGHRPRISEPCVTKPGRPRELNPRPQSARKVTPNPRIRKWNSGRIRRASAGTDRAFGEPRRIRILPRPGPGGLARGQLPLAPAPERRDASPGTGMADIPWAHVFVPEPASPDVVAPVARCPGGVARAVMEEPFFNLVAAAVTLHDLHTDARRRDVHGHRRIARCRSGHGPCRSRDQARGRDPFLLPLRAGSGWQLLAEGLEPRREQDPHLYI